MNRTVTKALRGNAYIDWMKMSAAVRNAKSFKNFFRHIKTLYKRGEIKL